MNTSRRDFLGKAVLAAGGSALSGCGAFSIGRCQNSNSRLSLAQVGTANRAWADLSEIGAHPRLDVAALCDVDSAYLARAHRAYPNARTYRDWHEMLDAEGDRIDAVFVGVPDHNHCDIAVAAMRRGKHVMCEKPMAHSLGEIRLMRSVAAETGVVTQLGTQYAALTADRQTVEVLRSGVIGPVRHAWLFSNRKGKSRQKRHLPDPSPVPDTLDWKLWLGRAAYRPYARDVYHPTMWRIWHDFGSGWIGDMGSHIMSSLWLGLDMGNRLPIDVRAEVLTDDDNAVTRICWPRGARIAWTFPGVAATDGKDLTVEWFDGQADDPAVPKSLLPPEFLHRLFAEKTSYEKLFLQGKVVECEKGWLFQGHENQEFAVVMKDGSSFEPPFLASSPSHYHDFVDKAVYGGRARSDFSWSASMSEALFWGNIAEKRPNERIVCA